MNYWRTTLVASTIVLIIGARWSHHVSGAQFTWGERALAIVASYIAGTSLLLSSLLLLVAPKDAAAERWIRGFAVVAGLLAVALAVVWAWGHKRYIDWCIRHDPTAFAGRGWASYPRAVWLMARWLPPILLTIGGATLIVVR